MNGKGIHAGYISYIGTGAVGAFAIMEVVMDRAITKRELILGCILCLCLTFTVFLPRVVFHPYNLAEELSDALADDMVSVLNQYLMGVGEFIGVESTVGDEDVAELSEMICEKLREGFFGEKSCEITSADILRLDRTILKEAIDEAFLEFDREYKIQLSDIIDSENLSKVLYQSVKQELTLVKITLWLLYGVPLLLAGMYILTYIWKKRRRMVVFLTAGYILAGVVAQLFWCMRLPGIVTDVFHGQSEIFVENLAERLQESVERKFSKNSILEGFVGGVADGLIQENFVAPMLSMCGSMEDILKDALEDSFGSGVWLHFVLLALLFGWCLWGVKGCFFRRQPGGNCNTGAGTSVGNRYVGSAGPVGNRYADDGGQRREEFGKNGHAGDIRREGGEFKGRGRAGYDRQGREVFGRNAYVGGGGRQGSEVPGGNGYIRDSRERIAAPVRMGLGIIRITRGELAGAEFRVPGGTPIIIGNNPAQAHLIFSGLAERHCKIQFRLEAGTYIIYSCVRGGVALADGRFLPAGRPMQIPAGTQIILGMPENGRAGYKDCLWLG